METVIQNISVNRCVDFRLLEKFLQDPEIYSKVIDDSAPPVEQAFLSPEGLYLLVRKEGVPVGFFGLQMRPDATYMVHTLLGKSCRGRDALTAGKLGTEWAFENTHTPALESVVIEGNRPAEWFARMCGFSVVGIENHSVPVNGNFVCKKLFKLTRKNWEENRRNNLCQSV